MATTVLWFRRDLRLVPLFVLDPAVLRPAGPNRRLFLAEALRALNEELEGTLVIRRGPPNAVVPAVAAEVGARRVVVSADFAPYGSARDRSVAEALSSSNRCLVGCGSPYALAPGTVRSAAGMPLRVFGAFRRRWETIGHEDPVPVPAVRFRRGVCDAEADEVLGEPASPGECSLPSSWEGLPLESAAQLPAAGPKTASARLDAFVAEQLERYSHDRDFPGVSATSRLSPYLRFGCIHPRTVLSRIGSGPGAERLRAELARREFYADVLWNRPDSARRSLQPFGDHLKWDSGTRARERFRAWATGRTGYPLVDAPFHRVLNPRLQQERFDPDGAYVGRFLAEPGKPRNSSREVGDAAPCPGPLVEHDCERREALDRFHDARRAAAHDPRPAEGRK